MKPSTRTMKNCSPSRKPVVRSPCGGCCSLVLLSTLDPDLNCFLCNAGHCNVPNKFRRDRPLGRWAAKMREIYSCDELDADRKKALNDIGFVWIPPSAEVPASKPVPKDTSEQDGAGSKEDASGTNEVVVVGKQELSQSEDELEPDSAESEVV